MKEPQTHTQTSDSFDDSDLLENEVVFTAELPLEQRGDLSAWESLSDEKIVLLKYLSSDEISVTFNRTETKRLSLRSVSDLQELFQNCMSVLIDITSLRHNIWAPLIKFCSDENVSHRVMYIEPAKYTKHPSPSSDTYFDLTTKFEGMRPLPGFAKLGRDLEEGNDIFVTMLGFEGSRPRRLLSDLEPPPKVIPIIGVSAFRIEYPAYAVSCNKGLLEEHKGFAEIRHARASCPFEVYSTLTKIKADFPDSYMYIAPVGTKPHALGAVMFHLHHSVDTELLYDNPVGKENRTRGRAQVHVYDMKRFSELND